MGIVTVVVTNRPRTKKTKIRRRLAGQQLYRANGARKYLQQVLDGDGREKAKGTDVAASRLILGGDADAEGLVQSVIDLLDEAIASKVKLVTNK